MKQYPPYEADNPPGAPLVSSQRKGTKPRVKRYSVEELRSAYESWQGTNDEFFVTDFLDWLEEQANGR